MAVKNKKQYYITEEHIDNDGNEYDKKYGGPYTFRNPYNLSIRGPGL